MPRLQRKSFSHPDEVRRFPNGHTDIVELDETAIARFAMDPGWRWSHDVAPLVGTSSCQLRHLGYVISGRLHILMNDGTEIEFQPGDAYEIPPGHDGWVVGDEPWHTIEFASGRTFAAVDAADNRTLATILFTDIVDSTATLSRLGDDRWREILLDHNERLRASIDRFRGREIVTTGDGVLAVFDSAARAIRCASAMVAAVRDLELEIRAGLHTGEVDFVGGNVRGIAVHAAARIAALAGASEILVSATTRDLADGAGLRFQSRGRHQLKGLDGERELFALAHDDHVGAAAAAISPA
jgi:class 3 adenylate cyclase